MQICVSASTNNVDTSVANIHCSLHSVCFIPIIFPVNSQYVVFPSTVVMEHLLFYFLKIFHLKSSFNDISALYQVQTHMCSRGGKNAGWLERWICFCIDFITSVYVFIAKKRPLVLLPCPLILKACPIT